MGRLRFYPRVVALVLLAALLGTASIYFVTQARACDWLLALVIRDEGSREIYLSTESARDLRNLSNEANADDYDPVWSPDGRYLIYIAEQFDTRSIQLKLLTLATGETQLLAEADPYHAYHAVWSPDGRYIALRTQLAGLVIMNTAGETLLTLDADSHFDLPVAWSPDSQQLAFTTQAPDAPSNGERWLLDAADVTTGAVS